MTPEQSSPESHSRPTRNLWRTKLGIAGTVAGALVLAMILALVFTSSSNEIVWLTPGQFTRNMQPGPFAGIKQKIKKVVMPVWRRFRRTPPLIRVESQLMTLTPAALEQAGLGAPATTSDDGMRAWILTPSESEALQQRIKANPGVSVLGRPRIQTTHRGHARLFSGNSAPAPGAPQTGITVDLIPRINADSIRLTISATATENVQSPTDRSLVRTNFVVACQAAIPNGGCLVLDGGAPKDGDGRRLWMILSPTAIDAQGKPIKR